MYIFETNFYFNDMLTKFAVTNYRGFKDRIEWDLSHPSNYEFNTHVIKDGVWRCSILRIICLRNGKSRIITKISFMQEGKT